MLEKKKIIRLYEWDNLLFCEDWAWWNQSEGIISVCKDNKWYTIKDKNEWASLVYNWNDNNDELWKKFQWWNTIWRYVTAVISTTKVDTTWYWPGNYYFSDVKIEPESGSDWSSVNNDDLWWWETNTNTARQWPCYAWFHVPSAAEATSLISMVTNLWMTDEDIISALGFQLWDGYWTSDWSNWASYDIYFFNWLHKNSVWRQSLMKIIQFHNSPKTPDSDWTLAFDWSSLAEWAGVYTYWTEVTVSDDWVNWITYIKTPLWYDTNINLYQWWNNYWFECNWSSDSYMFQSESCEPFDYFYAYISISDSLNLFNFDLWVSWWHIPTQEEAKAIYWHMFPIVQPESGKTFWNADPIDFTKWRAFTNWWMMYQSVSFASTEYVRLMKDTPVIPNFKSSDWTKIW